METVQINEKGTIFKKGTPITSPVFRYLSHIVEMGLDFKLISFFKMLETYPELIQLSDFITPLMTMIKHSAKIVKTDEIDCLIFFKTISIKGFPGEPGLDIYHSLKGVKQEKNIELKFFQMESLLDHSLHLGKLKHIIFGDGQDVFSYETFYTLFELIEGITWEMSFNFNPKECVLRR